MNRQVIITLLLIEVALFIAWGHLAPSGYQCHHVSSGAVSVCL